MTAGTQQLRAPFAPGSSGRVERVDAAQLRAEMIAEATTAVGRAVAIAAGAPESKAVQRYWICEQRRTCTRIAGRWECRVCKAIS